MERLHRVILVFLVLVLAPMAAVALPSTKEGAKSDDDTTVSIKVWDKAVLGDPTSWCQVRVVVANKDVKLSADDTVEVRIYEDDLVGDDQLWQTKFTVTAAEVAAGVDRTFDCPIAIPEDVSGNPEVYAWAEVKKKECTWFCLNDVPATDPIEVPLIEDDNREADDTGAEARMLGLGATDGLVCRDQDWNSFELTQKADISFTAKHLPAVGRLDVVVYGPDGAMLLAGTDTPDATVIEAQGLHKGKYQLRVSPRVATDFNFYDMHFTLTVIPLECEPDAVGTDVCGNCGAMARTCDWEGFWLPWSACEGEGVCAPAAVKTEPCGSKCGTVTSTCDEACAWVEGTCGNEGVCEAGQKAVEACDDLTERERECSPECAWGEWSACAPTPCDVGSSKSCYSGPEGTEGKGPCKGGTRSCAGTTWSATCKGEVVPADEVCDDSVDNDCDGTTDAADADCEVEDPVVGRPCTADADCPDFACLSEADHPTFDGGYCSKTCASDAECGEAAVCVHATDDSVCVRTCAAATDCREGYACAPAGTGKGCLPLCTSDLDCKDPERPFCHDDSGICLKMPQTAGETTTVADTAVATDEGGTPEILADAAEGEGVADALSAGDATTPVVETKLRASGGGGCTAGLGASPTALLAPAMFVLFAAWRRRRAGR